LKPPAPPLLFRIVGKAKDGQVVTVGKYNTRAEAEADHARLKQEAYYRDLSIHEIPPAPAPPVES
jgi:hypothetical protein